MTEMLEQALRKVAALPKEEQDAIASQIIDTLQGRSCLGGAPGAQSRETSPAR